MYTAADVAKKLNVNKRTILREIKRGNITASKVGNKFMISEKELTAYMSRNSTQPTKKPVSKNSSKNKIKESSQSGSTSKSKANARLSTAKSAKGSLAKGQKRPAKSLKNKSSNSLKNNKKQSLQDKIAEFIKQKQSEMIYHLQRMIAISSVNDDDNEEVFARYISRLLKKSGIRNIIIGKGDSVSVKGTYGLASKGLLFNCPLDTVSAGNIDRWTYPPFEGVVHDGKMYGRGAIDAKSGIVAMIYAVLALKQFVKEEDVRIELVFDGGEQSGEYLGMKEILKKGLDVSGGIVGYGGDQGEVGIGARGYHRFKLIMHGQSVHTGSRSRDGVNAISQMASLISYFNGNPFHSHKQNYFDFGSKMNIVQIQGGVAVNVVPDRCEAVLDFRTLPSQNVNDAVKYILNVIKIVENQQGCKFSCEVKYITGKEGYVLKENEKLVTDFSTLYNRLYDIDIQPVAHGASHIGALLYEKNIPVIVWGPQGANSHAYDEYVEINSLVKTGVLFSNLGIEYFNSSK